MILTLSIRHRENLCIRKEPWYWSLICYWIYGCCHLCRQAYNEAFKNHGVTSPQTGELVQWSTELYDEMSNSIGGGKPKMRWFFTERDGLPTSNSNAQSNEELIDLIQEEKNEVYQSIIASGAVSPRPGVLNIMDEAFALGIPMAVCSSSLHLPFSFPFVSFDAKAHLYVMQAKNSLICMLEYCKFALAAVLGIHPVEC